MSILKRLNLTDDEFRINLLNMVDHMTLREIASHYMVGFRTICYYANRYEIHGNASKSAIRAHEKDGKYINDITSLEKECVDGCLLGDGSIVPCNTSYSAFRFQYRCNYGEIHSLVKSFLPNFMMSEAMRCGTGKLSYSVSFRNLKQYRERWYSPHKIVPHDVILSPISCYFWYIGDGTNQLLKSGKRRLYLATCGFNLEENKFLSEKLSNIGFKVSVNKNGNNQYKICILQDSTNDFLWYILSGVKNMIPLCYDYKFLFNKG